MNAIELRKLFYKVSDKKILDDVSLHIEEGQFVGLIGPNGSGKTSLLRHIYRALPYKKNTIFIHGRSLEQYTYRESAREITVMRQENSGEFDYSVLEIVTMGLFPHKLFYEASGEQDQAAVANALNYVGMEKHLQDSFCSLSGGEKQRVLIARSLVQRANIILLDEPTNHLDVHYQWRVLRLIKELDKTTFSVFHDLNLALAFCDYIYVLESGNVVAAGEPEKIITSELLKEVFRVDAHIIRRTDGLPYIVYYGDVT